MTVAIIDPAVSIRTLLFARPEDADRALVRALQSAAAPGDIGRDLGRMADAATVAVVDRIGGVAGEILDLDLTAIFGRAWGRYQALVEVAEETAREPDLIRLAEIVAHTMSVAYRPRVEVYRSGRRIAAVPAELTLAITLRGMVIEVRDGHLVGVRGGNGVVDTALSIAGQPVARRVATVDLVRALPFRAPIRLA